VGQKDQSKEEQKIEKEGQRESLKPREVIKTSGPPT